MIYYLPFISFGFAMCALGCSVWAYVLRRRQERRFEKAFERLLRFYELENLFMVRAARERQLSANSTEADIRVSGEVRASTYEEAAAIVHDTIMEA